MAFNNGYIILREGLQLYNIKTGLISLILLVNPVFFLSFFAMIVFAEYNQIERRIHE